MAATTVGIFMKLSMRRLTSVLLMTEKPWYRFSGTRDAQEQSYSAQLYAQTFHTFVCATAAPPEYR
jgi:hypothetical protein